MQIESAIIIVTAQSNILIHSAIIAHLQDDRTYAFGCMNG